MLKTYEIPFDNRRKARFPLKARKCRYLVECRQEIYTLQVIQDYEVSAVVWGNTRRGEEGAVLSWVGVVLMLYSGSMASAWPLAALLGDCAERETTTTTLS